MADLQKACAALQKRKFQATIFNTAEQAKAAALELFGDHSVGFGGSMTIDSLRIYEALQSRGNSVFWHWKTPPAENRDVFENARKADYYLSSANAITESGILVNIDGTGNRVAGMIFGPQSVVVIAGKNKLVDGGIPEAIDRIKTQTCGKNARRLNLKTPCAQTDKCYDCHNPHRMCNTTVIVERPTNGKTFHVFLVDQELGW